MSVNEEVDKLWNDFKNEIKHTNRFFHDNNKFIKSFHDILEKLINYSRTHSVGELVVYRARIGQYKREKDIRKPSPKKIFIDDKRCNPKGISYFYVAATTDTAINEARPKINDEVTVGKFICKNSIKICYLNIVKVIEKEYVSINLTDKEKYLLEVILNEISKPISSEDSLEYIPIQYIVEYTKNFGGFDCFCFKSSLGTGSNYVFFDDKKFDFVEFKYYKITNYKFDEY